MADDFLGEIKMYLNISLLLPKFCFSEHEQKQLTNFLTDLH